MGGKFFRKTASYGHFGRRDLDLPWENVEEKAAQLAEASKYFYKYLFMPDNFFGGLDLELVVQEYL